ncbi:MAG: ParA family protein [Clostridia bacterium]|nr:ParA family protein [Clostridia bacterium]
MAKPVVIAFANQKGGVGKTTSAVNIAAAIGEKGYNVLLCDLDPQGNSTSGVGINKKGVKYSSYEALLGQCTPDMAVTKTKWENLSVMPSTINLAGAEIDLLDMEERERRFSKTVEGLSEPFDFIIVDCPPSLGMLTINALTGSDGVIIPMQCEYYALEGLSQLMITIKKIKQAYNKNLYIMGILITMFNGRLNLSNQVASELKKYYADKLFKTTISRNVKVSEAPSFGEPVIYYDKYSKGSLAYKDVAEELLERIC